ncbi:MAG: response regulator [Candidatus Aminicenantales bacterium]
MKKVRILVVEDEAIIAKDIQNILKNFGYQVTEVVSSGEESIRAAENLRPSLVLMDIRIKGDMNGREAAEKIHANYRIPIVYITAYGDEKTRQEAFLKNGFDYIPKPFEEREIENVLKKYLPECH